MKKTNSEYGVLILIPALFLSVDINSVFSGGIYMYVLSLSLYPLSFLFSKEFPAGEKAALSLLMAGFLLSVTVDYFAENAIVPHLFMTTIAVLGIYMIDSRNFSHAVKFISIIKKVSYIIFLTILIYFFKEVVFPVESGLFFATALVIALMNYLRI